MYFDYDAYGKTRFLDMEFRNGESWAGFIPKSNSTSFLDREYCLEPYVELDLPDTLKFGNFRTDLTLGREGCLFQGDYEEPFHGDGTPEDWHEVRSLR